ncbi:hypothetical protein AMECASPLE_030910 [Ameca splendens]|uniref:Uncharacterized protein n=1 Tax=Ameca splendens TaxID=208324 RepID=A0ABV0ZEW6_9TELE
MRLMSFIPHLVLQANWSGSSLSDTILFNWSHTVLSMHLHKIEVCNPVSLSGGSFGEWMSPGCDCGSVSYNLKVAGSGPPSSLPHVDVPLGKALKIKLPTDQCMNVCDWVNCVKRFQWLV